MRFDEIAGLLEDERCRSQLLRLANRISREEHTALDAWNWQFVQTPTGQLREYMVSTAGHILSLPRYRSYRQASETSRVAHRKFQPGRILSPGQHPSGMHTVTLYRDGSKESYYVHQLVAWTYLGPQPPGFIIRHRDGNPQNNLVENLLYSPVSTRFLQTEALKEPRERPRQLSRAILEALDGRRDMQQVLREVLIFLSETGVNDE
ncbi:MAG: hypothetical protein KatS3mg044_1233 [Rhodothermaceae bacterium]|nr:MAG: hypothetical protein KatS3mg044_1233 [Rhodothermaceae bacterium]